MSIDTQAIQPDLVVLKDGLPLVVVEAKGREIGGGFRRAVLRQLEDFAGHAGARWAILADPQTVKIYRADAFDRAAASLSTGELDGRGEDERIGEHTVLLAVERWLRDLPMSKTAVGTNSALRELAQSLARADQYSFEYGG